MAAAERETLEETGLSIRVTGFLGIWIDEYEEGLVPGQPVLTFNVYYHAELTCEERGTPDPEETLEMAWFEATQLPDPAFPGHMPQVLEAWRTSLRRA